MDELIETILNFLDSIEIEWHKETIEGATFLPGLKLRSGTLIIDTKKLLYPGDILHEAGHLATMPPEIRSIMNNDLDSSDLHQGGEMMAIAWSFAACIQLNIDPHIVFHEYGYKNGGADLVKNFSEGKYLGVPLLQWSGMTYGPEQAKQHAVEPFPAMLRWTCVSRPA